MLIYRYPYIDLSQFKILTHIDDNAMAHPEVLFKDTSIGREIDVPIDKLNDADKKALVANKPKPPFPKIWSVGGTVQRISDNPLKGGNSETSTRNPTDKYPKKLIDYPINQFRVYVNENSYFQSKLPHITNTKSLIKMKALDDIGKKFNLEDPYFVSLASMYTATFLCGISIQHLHESDGVPKIITSIIRFHVYFWLRRFIRNPNLLKPYSHMMGDLKKYIATRHIEMESGPDGDGNTGLFDTIIYKSPDDYLRYIPIKSNGLTNIGMKCLN